MRYRLALDIGTNSIGWWAYELDEEGHPFRSLAGGVRIFSDGRKPARNGRQGEPLAKERREKRGMRRRRDRYIRRRAALLRELKHAGLMPEDDEECKRLELLDPYDLRRRALDEALTPHELGRALFHLNQRRGFKSNRKTDARGDNEAGKIRTGVARLEQQMMETGARTFGEFLWQRRQAGLSTRARLRPESGEGAKGDGYDFYPARKLLEEEFDRIWQAQQPHHPALLNDNLRDRLRYIIFGQRPLKPPRVGKCTFVPEETRLPKAHPLFQELRLYQEVNHLEVELPGQPKRKLTRAERDKLVLALQNAKEETYKSLRKLLKLPEFARFNKERPSRDKMQGNEVRAALGDKKGFGPRWAAMNWQEQWSIIEQLLNEEDPDALHAWLTGELGLTGEQAEYVASVKLPSGYGRLGLTATQALLDELKQDVITYNEAVERAFGRSHSDFATGEILDELPYYGVVLEREIPPGTGDPKDDEQDRIGRITNPTVHIGLNQLRRIVNALIRRYGKPAEIVIELARELKMSDEQRKKYDQQLSKNTKKAEERGRKLEELGIENNGRNRLMLRLWEELDELSPSTRMCVYTGKPISIRMLFSGEVDIDHILPYSKTLDDSAANKIVCLTEANRFKRNRTPWEAWGDTDEWEAIAERAQRLPANKRWRFAPDALQRYEQEADFLPRQLVETQYLARMARKYLAALYPVELSKAPVWVTNGRMTEMLRRRWCMNILLADHNHYDTDKAKNRQDHRHHAIDAAVIGLTDRKLVHNINTAAARMEADGLEDYVWKSVPEQPWEGFREEVRAILENMVVSHRPRRKDIDFSRRSIGRDRTAGRLHNDTAYGLTGETNERGVPLVVHRVPLESLKSTDIAKIRDEHLRDLLWAETRELSDKEFPRALTDFANREKIDGKPNPYRGLRRVRIVEPLKTIPISDRRTGQPYKSYKGDANYCFEVWELPNGRWVPVVISMFDAHQPHLQNPEHRKPHPAARRLMRIFQNDMCVWEDEDGQRIIGRVIKFSQGGQVTLCPHAVANADNRNRNKNDPFKFINPTPTGLKRMKFRLIHVDEIGQVRDPGPFD